MVRIIQAGDWPEGAVTTEQVDCTRRVEPQVEVLIEAAWTAAAARPGVHLFDGPMCRLESMDASERSLHLRWSSCGYRQFLGTNMAHPELYDQFGPTVMANPIGLSVVVIASNNQLLLGRRNQSVAYYPGRVHPIAGCMEPQDATPFVGIRRELFEELNLDASSINSIRCIGLVEDESLRQMEVIFVAEVLRSADEIDASLDPAEHKGLWRCEANRSSVEASLAHGDEFTPVAMGTLSLYRDRISRR